MELVHNAVSSSHEMVARAGGEQGNPGSNKVNTESRLFSLLDFMTFYL